LSTRPPVAFPQDEQLVPAIISQHHCGHLRIFAKQRDKQRFERVDIINVQCALAAQLSKQLDVMGNRVEKYSKPQICHSQLKLGRLATPPFDEFEFPQIDDAPDRSAQQENGNRQVRY
jgi:hypothetical protein